MVRARTSSPQRGRTLSPHRGTGLLPAAPPQRVCASIRLGRGFPLAPLGHATEITSRGRSLFTSMYTGKWSEGPSRSRLGRRVRTQDCSRKVTGGHWQCQMLLHQCLGVTHPKTLDTAEAVHAIVTS